MMMQRKGDRLDWQALFRELGSLYRGRSSGGSKTIGDHCRFVSETIGRIMQADCRFRPGAASDKPVTVYFQRTLERGNFLGPGVILRSIERVRDQLEWRYGYEEIPFSLKKKFAFAEFCGPRGPLLCNDLILGLVLFAPGCVYPNHAHEGITESYICLSGSVSENNQGVYCAGSMIFNPAGKQHKITVSQKEPALLLYAWVGEPELLANSKMVFCR